MKRAFTEGFLLGMLAGATLATMITLVVLA